MRVAFPENLWCVSKVYGPIIIFEIFSDPGPLLSEIGYGPENGQKSLPKLIPSQFT